MKTEYHVTRKSPTGHIETVCIRRTLDKAERAADKARKPGHTVRVLRVRMDYIGNTETVTA